MIDPDPLAPVNDALLDRIVEGDLSPSELRAALDRVEHESDGWKRCALAFLEAQCWRESFRTIDQRASTDTGGFTSTRPTSTAATSGHRAGSRRLAIAAGIAALAFALGWRVRPEPAGLAHPAEPPALANADHRATSDPGTTVAPRASIVDRHPEKPAAPESIRSRKVIALPIVARPRVESPSVTNQPPPITEHQLALLEQRGYQVDRRRRLITATLADGRRVTVPVEQIQLRYTGVEPL